jgi:PASTA domain
MVRGMSQEPDSAGDNADRKPRKRPELVSQLILPVVVVVVGAVLVTALTPLGASLRELLFHTTATVAGSVTVDGKPAASVHLQLDGVDVGNTDVGGRFLLTEVGKGQHRLHLELVSAKPTDESSSVASGQTALQIGNVEMDPLVRFTYTASADLSGPLAAYDITLWIIGDSDALNRIKSVSYTLPVPLSSRPVSGTDARHAFCYRQTGSLPYNDFYGNSAPVPAVATVDLGAGKKFQISALASKVQPPDCPAHQAGPAAAASATPSSAQQPSSPSGQRPSSPEQSGSSPAKPAPQLTEVPSVIGLSEASAQTSLQSAGFNVSAETEAAPADQPVAPGTVWGQKPDPSMQKPGSTVTILVQPAHSSPSTPTPTSGHGPG